jgi:hypothetical protein
MASRNQNFDFGIKFLETKIAAANVNLLAMLIKCKTSIIKIS